MALVSHAHKAIFLHCPKNGGSSIRAALGATGWVTSWKDPVGTHWYGGHDMSRQHERYASPDSKYWIAHIAKEALR